MKKNLLFFYIGFFVVFMILGLLLPEWMRYILTVALCKSFVVLGIVLLMRNGLVSFGHALYFAFSAYSIAFASRLLGITDVFLLLVIGLISGAAISYLIGLLVSRYREIYFAMITMAFSMAFYGVLVKAYRVTGGTDGLHIPTPTILGIVLSPADWRLLNYYLALVVLAIAVFLLVRLVDSPFGFLIKAVKQNEIRVSYLGGVVNKVVLQTFVISGALSGLGGALITFNLGHIDPHLSYWTVSGEFVFIALFSGIGNIYAAIGGAIIIEFVRTYAFKYAPYTWQMILGIIMLVVIMYSPGGLWEIIQRIGKRYFTRGASTGGLKDG